jgi:hypothetical protein
MGTSLFVSILPLFFLTHHIYRAWRWFALVILPLGILYILDQPIYSDNWMSFGPDTREEATFFFAKWFVFASYLFIASKAWKPNWKTLYLAPGIAVMALLAYVGVVVIF